VNEALRKICSGIAQERARPLLFLKLDFIDYDLLLKVQRVLKGKKFPALDVILITPGGNPHAAYSIIKVIRNHSEKVSIIVPLDAKSAGTLVCLGADELILSEVSELGPLDIQVPEHEAGDSRKHISALNGFKALEQIQLHAIQTLDVTMKMIFSRSGMKLSESTHLASEFCGQTSGTLYSQLDPKRIGEYARALDIGRQYAMLVLTRMMKWGTENATATVQKLVLGYPSHDFVIDYEETLELGLPSVLPDDSITDSVEDLREQIIKYNVSSVDLIEPESPSNSLPNENPKGKSKKAE